MKHVNGGLEEGKVGPVTGLLGPAPLDHLLQRGLRLGVGALGGKLRHQLSRISTRTRRVRTSGVPANSTIAAAVVSAHSCRNGTDDLLLLLLLLMLLLKLILLKLILSKGTARSGSGRQWRAGGELRRCRGEGALKELQLTILTTTTLSIDTSAAVHHAHHSGAARHLASIHRGGHRHARLKVVGAGICSGGGGGGGGGV